MANYMPGTLLQGIMNPAVASPYGSYSAGQKEVRQERRAERKESRLESAEARMMREDARKQRNQNLSKVFQTVTIAGMTKDPTKRQQYLTQAAQQAKTMGIPEGEAMINFLVSDPSEENIAKVVRAGERFGVFKELESEQPGSTGGDTDTERYVQRVAEQYRRDHGVEPEPQVLADAAVKYRRAQAEEAGLVRLAKRTVDAQTAGLIEKNATLGRRLAEIETNPSLIKSKGEITPIEERTDGRNRLAQTVAKAARLYLQLDSVGGIINTEKPAIDNIIARAKSSTFGQAIGNMMGTDEQSTRKAINNIKPTLVQDIRKATGMSARAMDSDRELQFYLQAVSDTSSDIQSNLSALSILDSKYGSGETAKLLEERLDPQYKKRLEDQAAGLRAKPSEKKDEIPTIIDQSGFDKLKKGDMYYYEGKKYIKGQ